MGFFTKLCYPRKQGWGYGEFDGFFSNGAQPWIDVVVTLVQNGANIDVSAYKDGGDF